MTNHTRCEMSKCESRRTERSAICSHTLLVTCIAWTGCFPIRVNPSVWPRFARMSVRFWRWAAALAETPAHTHAWAAESPFAAENTLVAPLSPTFTCLSRLLLRRLRFRRLCCGLGCRRCFLFRGLQLPGFRQCCGLFFRLEEGIGVLLGADRANAPLRAVLAVRHGAARLALRPYGGVLQAHANAVLNCSGSFVAATLV